jgi:AcrR family transcriptional regulator
MAKARQAIVLARRKPTQERARRTIEVIFEATARIIEREGADAVNTNLIAERAGVSIGTLYEYFPNKEAVLIAMARRQLAEDEQAVRTAVSDALEARDPPLARVVIRALVKLHQTRPKLRHAIMRAHISSGLGSEHARPVQNVAEILASRSDRVMPGRDKSIPPAVLFVATRAVIGVLRAAFEEGSPLLGQAALEDELSALVEGYLGGVRGAAADGR